MAPNAYSRLTQPSTTQPQQLLPPLLLLLLLVCPQGCISDDHPLCLGTIGVHGLFTANTAINQCDTVLALGTRFDERAACKSFELWQTPRTVIHVDIRPQEVMSGSHKNRITCSVVANVEDFVGVLLQHLYGLLEERNKTLSGKVFVIPCCFGPGIGHLRLGCVWRVSLMEALPPGSRVAGATQLPVCVASHEACSS